MNPTDKIDKLIKDLKTPASRQLDERIDALIARSEKQGTGQPASWSNFMKNPITKYAAAAMVFVRIIFGVALIPGSKPPSLLASVLETLQNAVCISYEMKLGDDSPKIKDTVLSNVIRREVMGTASIIDLEQEKILTLVEDGKQAISIDLKGLEDISQKSQYKNYVDVLVNILTEIQESEDFEIEQLGEQEFDGQTLVGTSAKHGNMEVVIWIDPETALPARITEKQQALEVTVYNFDFDVEFTPEMFSMEPPEGYTLIDGQAMLNIKKDGTEENFIFMLQILADLYDGWFPQSVSIESYMKNAMQMGMLLEEKYEGTVKQMQIGMNMAKGLFFLRFYKGHGPWHYAGNGVKFGQSDVPIFWYQPKDDGIWRVIFGDLHVEEVSAEDIDALTASREGMMDYGYQIWGKREIVGQQIDNLYVKADNMIECRTTIDIRTGPMFMPSVNIELPYEAMLISATLDKDETPLPFEQSEGTNYRFMPDGQLFASGEHVINLIYEFPIKNLEQVDYGYKVILDTLVPTSQYEVHATLQPDCGWIFKGDNVDNDFMTLFTVNGPVKSSYGTCGLPIEPKP